MKSLLHACLIFIFNAIEKSIKIPFPAVRNNRSFHQAANSEDVLIS